MSLMIWTIVRPGPSLISVRARAPFPLPSPLSSRGRVHDITTVAAAAVVGRREGEDGTGEVGVAALVDPLSREKARVRCIAVFVLTQ